MGRRLPKKLTALGSARPYFRISIESDQQRTLESAAKKLKGRALFTYAAPVFGTSRELFRHISVGSMVEHSTFPDVALLAGQHACYYNKPGAGGVPNRSFEPSEMLPFEARIAALIREHGDQSEEVQHPSAALAELFRDLQALITERASTGDEEQVRAAYLVDEWRRISALADEFVAPPALLSFLGIDAFSRYFNLLWLTIA